MPHTDSPDARPHEAPGAPARTSPDEDRDAAPPPYPVREYIGSMCAEMARMARWDGDENLALLLDIAARLAGEPDHGPVHNPLA